MEVAPVFGVVGGHVHGMPAAAIAGGRPPLEGEQCGDIEAIGLGAALAAIDFDARGIDDGVGDAARGEGPVQPEASGARAPASHAPAGVRPRLW
jgi:hypothetical protein